MSKHSKGIAGLPESALKSLRRSGENIRIARKKRRMPLKELSNRTMVSIPTLRKVESGDPSVSIGIFFKSLEFSSCVPFLNLSLIRKNLNLNVERPIRLY